MTREDLVSRLSERLGWAEPSTAKVLEALIDTVVEELLAGNRIDISDFGLFQTRKQSEYILVDREANERYLMPPSLEVVFEAATITAALGSGDNPVRFLPDESLEKEVNSSFALFEPTLLNEGVQFPGMAEVHTNQLEEESEARDPEEEGVEIPLAVENLPAHEESVAEEEPVVEEEPGELETRRIEKIESEIVEGPSAEEQLPAEDPPVEEQPPVEEPKKEPAEESQPAPPLRPPVRRKPKKRSPVWIPVAGGAAIALAVLFFFKATRTGKAVNINKDRFSSHQEEKATKTGAPSAQPGALAPRTGKVSSQIEEIDQTELEPVLSRLAQKKIKLEKGETLRRLAEDHFGHREFWVYIYLENKECIPNPNTIPYGIELLLPNPADYDMNPNDPQSIARAKSLGDEVLRAF